MVLLPGRTTLRLFPGRGESQLNSEHVQALNCDVDRLGEVASRQQEVLIEYALRNKEAHVALPAIAADRVTREWLARTQGVNVGGGGGESDLPAFNTPQHLKLVQERIEEARKGAPNRQGLFTWGFDTLQYADSDDLDAPRTAEQFAELACCIVDVLGFIEGFGDDRLDRVAMHKALRACLAAHSTAQPLHNMRFAVDVLHTVAQTLAVLEPESTSRARVSMEAALALVFGALVFSCRSGRTDDCAMPMGQCSGPDDCVAHLGLHYFLSEVLPANDFLGKLGRSSAQAFCEELSSVVSASTPRNVWTVVNGLEAVNCAMIEASQAGKGGQADDGAGEASQLCVTASGAAGKVLVRAILCAATQGLVCKEKSAADWWVRSALDELLQEDKAGIAQGKPCDALAEMVASGHSKRTCEALLALNSCDFVTAPLWLPLVMHVPKMQAALAHLFVNRAGWAATLNENCTAASEAELVSFCAKRTAAFQATYENVKYDPSNAAPKRKGPDTMQRADFITIEDKAMRMTGASNEFLSMLSCDLADRRSRIRQSLEESVGLIEPKRTGKSQAGVGSPGTGRSTRGFGKRKIKTQVAPVTPGAAESDGLGRHHEGAKKDKKMLVNLPRQFFKRRNTRVISNLAPTDRASRMRAIMQSVLEHRFTQPFLFYLTLFALFGDDLRLALFSSSADPIFGIITLVVLLVFLVEVGVKIATTPNYTYGFFFWLDLIATFSLLPDIPFVWDALLAGLNAVFTENSDLSLTRAGRASRAGARAARVIRILRLVRLLRILKLYEFLSYRMNKSAASSNSKALGSRRMSSRPSMLRGDSARYVSRYLVKRRISRAPPSPHAASTRDLLKDGSLPQSKVGAKLADLTTRRVIKVVLAILFMLPVFSPSEEDLSLEASAGMLNYASFQFKAGFIDEAAFNSTLETFVHSTKNLLVLICDAVDHEPLFGSLESEDSYRTAELRKAAPSCNPSHVEDYAYCNVDIVAFPAALNVTTYASVDNKQWEVSSAWRNVGQTLFIIVVLGVATMVFTYDAQKLVIAPIEKMVRIVEELAENPLTTFENDDDSDDENESELLKQGRKRHKKKEEGGYETKLLENCIKKIGGLLQVGFGEAGAEIIAANMNGSGELDPMLPGRKIQAVFGFCDIRSFMATTEVLGEEVMLYVNEIASIVHSQVSSHSGHANRNMGDSFLLLWKRPANSEDDWTSIAEKALISFLKINVEINRSPDLAQYNSGETKTGKRLQKHIPGFRVRLGFGLHIGWAIEGAIGSNRKIDASYLSPHINITGRLQEYTRQYGVTLLFSSHFYDVLGSDARTCSRQVDKVVLKGTKEPVGLYTYDCDFTDLGTKLAAINLKGDSAPASEEVIDRRISLIGPSPIIDHDRNLVEVTKSAFRTDLELRALQWELPTHFLPLCRKAVGVYLAGNWKDAKVLMEAAIRIKPSEKDGPCGSLLTYMGETDFKAPADWPGFRSR